MDLLTTLEQIGLKEPEAKVYLALLDVGPATVLPIAKAAGVTRTYCYDLLASLIQKGLASQHEIRNRRRYVAQDPTQIKRQLKRKMENYEQILPQLTSLYSRKGSRAHIQFFEGAEGVRTVFDQILAALKPGDTIDNLFSTTHVYEVFGEQYVNSWGMILNKKQVHSRDLLAGTPSKEPSFIQYYGSRQHYRWLPASLKITTDLILYKNKLVLVSYKPDTHAAVIEGSSIVETHQLLYDLLWQAAK